MTALLESSSDCSIRAFKFENSVHKISKGALAETLLDSPLFFLAYILSMVMSLVLHMSQLTATAIFKVVSHDQRQATMQSLIELTLKYHTVQKHI